MTLSPERRRLALLGALPCLVLLLAAVHLWLLVHGNASARADYDAERYAEARAGFDGAHDLGVVSPWIAPFDAGTAAYGDKKYATAVKRFEEALDLVPEERECDVRVDLALTHEAIADRAAEQGRKMPRQVGLRDAREAIAGTGCSEGIEKRLEEKIKDVSSDGGKSEEEKLDEIEKKNREAAKVKDVELEPKNEPDRQIQW